MKTGSQITKVNPYHYHAGVRSVRTDEMMIDFEFRRKNYGAIDTSDSHDLYGNYYTIYWKTERPDIPVTVRLEYLQASTGPKIFKRDQVVDAPKRTNTTKFEIIGDEYSSGGAVTRWKASIIQNGMVVDEFKSFLWQ